ncbi:hypothetical protein AADZ90_016305 [Aestuariibius sp. 2305UL40-4]|uniref:hypothetical protein n=1 Tax=Aestuariibius violaceus TaxID=3234132 RepID=UPI00345E12E7
MKTTDDIARKLAALSSMEEEYLPGGARVISRGGTPEPLQAILREIDETVLQRKLTFKAANDASVAMVIAGRRMQGVADLSADLDGGAVSDLKMRALTKDDAFLLEAFSDLMRRFAEGAEDLSVTSEPAERLGSAAEAGLSVSSLTEIWAVDMWAPPPSRIGRFLKASRPRLDAFVQTSGEEEVGKIGETTRLTELDALLKDRAKSYGAALQTLRPDAPEVRLSIAGAAAGGSGYVALAEDGDDRAALAFRPDALSDILSAWGKAAG